MNDLEAMLAGKVTQINSAEEQLKKIRAWVNGWHGKIVGIVSPERAYHLVFTADGVRLVEGDYPSCEISYRGSEQALRKVLERDLTAYGGMKTGALQAWGSLNEAIKFESLL